MALYNVSEHPEPNATGWHDCWLAARMSELRAAGFRFPLTDLVREREALERAQTLVKPETNSGTPPMAAADAAIASRYGLTDHASSALEQLLARAGLAITAEGVNARLPARLRHWDPAFAGTHQACFVTGAGTVTILDPEAPMGYAGDPITAAEVLSWWDRSAVRFLAVGELAVEKLPMWTNDATPADEAVHLPIGTPVYGSPGDAKVRFSVTHETTVHAVMTFDGWWGYLLRAGGAAWVHVGPKGIALAHGSWPSYAAGFGAARAKAITLLEGMGG